MMNVNKIMRLGSLVFTIVLFVVSIIKYFSGQNKPAAYYFIAAIGFLIVYTSYWKNKGSVS